MVSARGGKTFYIHFSFIPESMTTTNKWNIFCRRTLPYNLILYYGIQKKSRINEEHEIYTQAWILRYIRLSEEEK